MMVVAHTLSSQPKQQGHIKHFGAGVTQEWLFDNRVVVYSGPNASRAAVDAYCAAMMDVVNNWPHDKPLLSMHDLSSTYIMLTPYAQMKTTEVARAAANFPDTRALVVPNSFIGQTVSFFIRRNIEKFIPGESAVFTDRDEALTWLMQYLPD